jgi:putrescine aminotransferase
VNEGDRDSEAVESALKLSRLATRRIEIVAAKNSFHGFTLGALSISGVPSQSRPFQPLLPGVKHVPFVDSKALDSFVTENTAAVVLEPCQAEVGAENPPLGYLKKAREICDRYGALLIIDEVRTGMGRTGPLFAIENANIVPDILVLGKSLGGGIVPIGAVIARPHTWRRFGLSFSMSASSFAGNRLACV